MPGIPFYPAISNGAAYQTRRSQNAPARVHFAHQSTVSGGLQMQAVDRFTPTMGKPHESAPALSSNRQDGKPRKPHPQKISALAQKHGKDFVLNDFTLKRKHLGNWQKHQPLKASEVKAGQTLIHKKTGKEVEVTKVLTPRLSKRQQGDRIQVEIVRTVNGQTKFRPIQRQPGYRFQFIGIVRNPKGQPKPRTAE